MATRAKVSRKLFHFADGTTSKNAGEDIVKVTFDFYDPDYSGEEADRPILEGETITITKEDVDGLPGNVHAAMGWHGLGNKLLDSYSGQAKSDETPWDIMGSVWEAMQSGIWVKRGESAGPRSTLLLEALQRARVAAGKEVTPEWTAKAAESIKTPEQKKAAKANKVIAKHLAEIEQERAAARLKAANKAAKDGDDDDGFLADLMED